MINLFCALHCEAGPLIQKYNLKRLAEFHHFETYIDEKRETSLTITGIGKTSAAGAVIHALMGLPGHRSDGWLNVGIAGQMDLPAGTAVLADKVVDAATGRTWYPQILFKHTVQSATVVTLDKPSSDYPPFEIVDMEAAGFYSSVTKAGLMELSHSLKIISDNRASHYSIVDRKFVSRLIGDRLDTIDALINELSDLSGRLHEASPMETTYEQLVSGWHFTRSQRQQLRKLLARWSVLLPGEPVLREGGKKPASSAEIIASLNERLARTPVRLPDPFRQ